MSVELMESLTSVAIGAADAYVQSKVTQTLPGGIPAGVAFEVAGILAGMFGQKVGIPASVRDPLMMGALTLAGHRAAKAAMAGNLFSLHGLGAAGGGDAYGGGGNVQVLPAQRSSAVALRSPNVRRIGRGGMGPGDLYGGYVESGGVAS